MEDTKKIYLSAMIPTELLDDDDDLIPSEVVGDHLVQYEFIDLIENIGQEEFKETYMNFIEDIQKQSFDNQRILCYHIIDKIQEVYGFEFPEKINIDDISNIEEIYKFVEFLEYDNEQFLSDIFSIFNIDFLKVDPYEFCKLNQEDIIRQINIYDKTSLSYIFINLYDTLENNILINMIGRMISKNKGSITNNIKMRELNLREV